jgi:hypothetical protein
MTRPSPDVLLTLDEAADLVGRSALSPLSTSYRTSHAASATC